MTLLITMSFSCKKETDFGDINDNNDWTLNVKFTDREKQLFDTIDFNKTATVEDPPSDFVSMGPSIKFYPNPVEDYTRLEYNQTPGVLNIVMVDSHFI